METTVNKEVSEERQQKYWRLSGFLNHVDFMRQHHPDKCPADLINGYLDNEEFREQAWKEVADYEEKCHLRNTRILRAIKNVKGRTFYKYLMIIIEDTSSVDGMMEIVRQPRGKWQKEDFGRTIKGIWVEQWSVGMEGDSFEGYVCVQLKENKYLQFRFRC